MATADHDAYPPGAGKPEPSTKDPKKGETTGDRAKTADEMVNKTERRGDVMPGPHPDEKRGK